ncbi:MAG: hypothetical protein M1826_007446 [Phylliscum demangeonii]|nr:MAG: hypothetical protein M1826_007446 [Phylliscum demangeonii]
MSSNLLLDLDQAPLFTRTTTSAQAPQQEKDVDVLFDAERDECEEEECEEEEDFGAFEGGARGQQEAGTGDLLGQLLDLESGAWGDGGGGKTASTVAANGPTSPWRHLDSAHGDNVWADDLSTRDASRPLVPVRLHADPPSTDGRSRRGEDAVPRPKPAADADDVNDWGAFVDADADADADASSARSSVSAVGSATAASTTAAGIAPEPAPAQPAHASSPPPSPPPTTIPPPAILLALIPSLLLSHADPSSSHSSRPASSSRPCLALTARTASRVLAGRRLRWKRDVFLRANTKIGPAQRGGGGGGMKLTALSRHETLVEDGEVAELLTLWRGPALASLRRSLPKGADIPDLAMAERPASLRVGGHATTTRACLLCGLRRDERLRGVDAVEEGEGDEKGKAAGAAEERGWDAFGEYWVEHWGHVDCRRFWRMVRDELRER